MKKIEDCPARDKLIAWDKEGKSYTIFNCLCPKRPPGRCLSQEKTPFRCPHALHEYNPVHEEAIVELMIEFNITFRQAIWFLHNLEQDKKKVPGLLYTGHQRYGGGYFKRLPQEAVVEICELLENRPELTQEQIATKVSRKFCVQVLQESVSYIYLGKNWKHISRFFDFTARRDYLAAERERGRKNAARERRRKQARSKR